MTEIYLDQNWQQIQPQRSVTPDTFAQGSILFNFNVSGLNSISMKDSYFVIESSLVRGNSTNTTLNPLEAKDRTTYAHNWTGALFTNVSVRVSGQEISACNQYNHLAHTVKMRQLVEENLLNTNMRDMMDYDIDFTRRLNRHITGGAREDGLTELSNGAGTPIRSGDVKRQTFYQPVNLGVFDLGHGSLCGDISIVLNPNPNFQTACVESAFVHDNDFVPAVPGTATTADHPKDYKFIIHSITLMGCYAKATKPIDNTKTFTIHEYSVMNKPYAPQLEFQVLPSTEQITVFIQDQFAGNNTTVPATSFKVSQFTDAEVKNWVQNYGKQYSADEQGAVQVTLGAITKPPIMLQPQKNLPGYPNQMIRWAMSHQYLEGHKSLWERYNDWCASPYFCFDFMRDSSDTSGFVTVRSIYDFSGYGVPNLTWSGGVAPYLFCCSKYSKIIKISYNSGYVTDIQMQNT
jgi:hypothetical protein